jgi:hypothetical protein
MSRCSASLLDAPLTSRRSRKPRQARWMRMDALSSSDSSSICRRSVSAMERSPHAHTCARRSHPLLHLGEPQACARGHQNGEPPLPRVRQLLSLMHALLPRAQRTQTQLSCFDCGDCLGEHRRAMSAMGLESPLALARRRVRCVLRDGRNVLAHMAGAGNSAGVRECARARAPRRCEPGTLRRRGLGGAALVLIPKPAVDANGAPSARKAHMRGVGAKGGVSRVEANGAPVNHCSVR